MKATLIQPETIEGDTFPTCSIIEKAEYKPSTADSKPTIKANSPKVFTIFCFLEKAITTHTNKKVNKDIVKTHP